LEFAMFTDRAHSHALPFSIAATVGLFFCFALLPKWRWQAVTFIAPPAVRVAAAYAQLPLSFEPNQGQADGDTPFLSRGPNYELNLQADGATLHLPEKASVTLKWRNANAQAAMRGEQRLPGVTHYLRGNDPAHWQRDVPNFAQPRKSAS
jgi:hypothetical protein